MKLLLGAVKSVGTVSALAAVIAGCQSSSKNEPAQDNNAVAPEAVHVGSKNGAAGKNVFASLARSFRATDSTEVTVTLLSPRFVQLSTYSELGPNSVMSDEDIEAISRRRMAIWTEARTCFAIKTKTPYDREFRPQEWAADLTNALGSRETLPIVFSRYEGIACSEKAYDLNSGLHLRLKTPFRASTSAPLALGTFSWNAPSPKELAAPLPEPLGRYLEILSSDTEQPKMKAIVSAMREGKLDAFKTELPPSHAYSRADFELMGSLALIIAQQGSDCRADMIEHLMSIGAELSPVVFPAANSYTRLQAYSCLPFAREMYRWAPSERSLIARQAHENLVREIQSARQLRTGSDFDRIYRLFEFYQFVSRATEKECQAGQKPACVEADLFRSNLPLIERSVTQLRTQEGQIRKSAEDLFKLLEEIRKTSEQAPKSASAQ